MFKKLLAALIAPAPPAGRAVRPRQPAKVKSLAELEAEIEAELDGEGASAATEGQRRSMVKQRIQDSTLGDAEAMAALVRSWMIEDGR
jgi:hypothetical protein